MLKNFRLWFVRFGLEYGSGPSLGQLDSHEQSVKLLADWVFDGHFQIKYQRLPGRSVINLYFKATPTDAWKFIQSMVTPASERKDGAVPHLWVMSGSGAHEKFLRSGV